MSWAPVALRWPAEATQWMGQMDAAKTLAGSELASTGQRLLALQGLASTRPGPVGAAAIEAIQAGRQALAEQLGEAPKCLVVTPFQSGIGQGRGYQRFLSAPNLLQLLANKLTDATDAAAPQGNQHALCLLFLGTRHEQLAAALGRFNALLPIPELVRAQRRAEHLARLETDKWQIPQAAALPRWEALPLERCTVLKAARQSIAGQVAVLESYAADRAPLIDLAELASRKAAQQQARDQRLAELRQLLEGSQADSAVRACMLGPGNNAVLRRLLLDSDAPGHEWVMCAGVILVGSASGLSFVREMVGL